MIAIAFAGLYGWINEVEPHGFFAQHIVDPKNVDFLYFSFVTITTVGYGDFVPVTWLGRFFAVFIMIMGISVFGIVSAGLAATVVKQNPAPPPPANVAAIDPVIRSRLSAGRRRALEALSAEVVRREFRVPGAWLPVGVAAFAAALAGNAVACLREPRSVVQLSAGSLLRPDLAVVATVTGKLWLAAEVVSSTDHRWDTVTKKELYER